MTSTSARTTGWLPLLSFRFSDDGEKVAIIASDPLHRVRARIDQAALLDLLEHQAQDDDASEVGKPPPLRSKLAELGWFPASDVDDETLRHAKFWWKNGWHPSLEYYLWSRQANYRDVADDSGEIRRALVRTYLESDGAPPERLTSSGARHALPAPPALPNDCPLGILLITRRSVRAFAHDRLDETLLSAALYHGLDDVRRRRQSQFDDELDYLQTHGVAFDIYVIVYDVRGVQEGVFQYDLEHHELIAGEAGNHRDRMTRILCGLRSPETAAWTIVLAADFAQYQWRYRHERALRHLYMAAGRLGQRLILVSLAYGLGTVPTPATHDRELCELLRLDRDRQAPIYTLTTGPRSGS